MFINQGQRSLHCGQWYAALTLGILAWLTLYLLLNPDSAPLWPLAYPGTFLLLVIVYPVLEEIVFRGLLQSWLAGMNRFRAQLAGFTSANLLTSLLFTAMHFFSHPPLMALMVFFPSLLFGYFRDRHDGWLIPSILLHIYYNAGYFLIFNPV